jgi:crotonobetainyl-CoA:carnitine CoA-transferase CaiB-like acyl-CoA transferase
MVALYHRVVGDRGKGQWIDVSLCESILRLLEGVIAEYGKLGTIRERSGNLNEVVAPADNFLSRDGKWVVFVVTSDGLFQRFAKAIGREDLAQDPRFLKNLDRLRNRDALHEIIRPWFQERTVSEIDAIFGENGVPYGLVYNAKDILEDPQNQFRRNIVKVQDPEIGPVQMQSVTPRLSLTPGKVRSSSPGLGEHNQEVWGELLGLTKEELTELRKERVI